MLFGEGPGGFLLAGDRDALEALGDGMAVQVIGVAEGDRIEIEAGELRADVSLADAAAAWTSLGERLTA
jgi:hypothetical protein